MPQRDVRDVIVIGTSAGGIEALKTLVEALPANLPAALVIAWHMSADHPSYLPQILDRVCALPVTTAEDGERIQTGRVYVASPDHHLVLEPLMLEPPVLEHPVEPSNGDERGRIRVTHGPKENFFRPSIDVLFRSAARAYGSRAIGVVLTGMLDDGASGLYAIKECGGMAVVQDPLDALYPSMPISAMKAVRVDHSIPVAEMGSLLARLVNEPLVNEGKEDQERVEEKTEGKAEEKAAEGGNVVSERLDSERLDVERLDVEVKIALEDNGLELGVLELGEPSLYSCPECHGVLIQIEEGPLTRFRCHVGHAYSLNALLSGVRKTAEDSLWSALRAIEEGELLLSHMARHLRENQENEAADLISQQVEQARQRAQLVRQAVLRRKVVTEETLTNAATA